MGPDRCEDCGCELEEDEKADGACAACLRDDNEDPSWGSHEDW